MLSLDFKTTVRQHRIQNARLRHSINFVTHKIKQFSSESFLLKMVTSLTASFWNEHKKCLHVVFLMNPLDFINHESGLISTVQFSSHSQVKPLLCCSCLDRNADFQMSHQSMQVHLALCQINATAFWQRAKCVSRDIELANFVKHFIHVKLCET